MGQITNGTIEYTRRLRTADFEHKDAKVSLSFTVADGEDPAKLACYVANVAVVQASVMVGEAPPATLAPSEIVVDAAPKTRQRRNPADVVIGTREIGASPMSPASAETTPPVSPPQPAESSSAAVGAPVASLDPMTGQSNIVALPTVVAAATAVDAMGLPTSAPVAGGPATDASQSAPSGEISDADLTGHISHKATQLGQLYGEAGLPKIFALVGEYVAPPGRSTMMTQPQRVEFLARLKGLA